MLACSMPCWHCPTCCMCCPFLSSTIGDTTGVLRDHWAAILVIWPVSNHCLVTGGSLVGIVICCGGCGLVVPTAVPWAAVGLHHHLPPEMFLPIGLCNFVNFKFNLYFMLVSFMYCAITLLYTLIFR